MARDGPFAVSFANQRVVVGPVFSDWVVVAGVVAAAGAGVGAGVVTEIGVRTGAPVSWGRPR